MTKTRLITSTQLAQILGLSNRQVTRLAQSGEIPAQKLPGKTGAYVFDSREIEAYTKAAAARGA